ncbi:MAG: UDP-N-acetylmuramoyl-L-alanyl-D-glutamate--2,6-diaminopimelate ligase [Myxococcales bacterium]|nr:UDP-N-acetylmuramoyl-L-alanyl-D-glutamate--2,6-diaminopimelate ligase [Myxococcales bacterium]
MRLGTLLGDLQADLVGCDRDTEIVNLAVDSRRVGPGDAFLAVAGLAHDGHAFIATAIAAGARVILLQRGRVAPPAHPHVVLADTASSLPGLAARAFGEPAEHLRLAGVTGTNGKTTVTFLVAAMLAAADRKHARLGTTGDWIVDHAAPAAFTTPFPLDLQRVLADALARGATDLVMEVSSHGLAQGRVAPLRYDAVGLTSFSQDHLDFHGTMDAYLAAKCLLASDYRRPGGVTVAAVDDQPAAAAFLAAAGHDGPVWRASRGADRTADIAVLEDMSDRAGFTVRLRTPAGEGVLRSPLVGAYNLDNLLVALGLALGLGVPLEAALAGLADCRGAPGRLERVQVPGAAGPAVFVDYAHTPDAVARALAAVRPACAGRLWIVLGCGGDRDPSKRPIMGRLAAAGADVLVATSDNPRSEPPPAIVEQMIAGVPAEQRDRVVAIVDRAAAIAHAITRAAGDDLVLVAGKGHEDYQVLGAARIHFDDREHAARALAARGPA